VPLGWGEASISFLVIEKKERVPLQGLEKSIYKGKKNVIWRREDLCVGEIEVTGEFGR